MFTLALALFLLQNFWVDIVPLAELFISAQECFLQLKVGRLFEKDVTSGPHDFVVVAVQYQWERPFLFQLPVHVSLQKRNLGLETRVGSGKALS